MIALHHRLQPRTPSARLAAQAARLALFGFLAAAPLLSWAQEVQVAGGEAAEGDGTPVKIWRIPVRVSVSLNTGYDENPDTTESQEGSVFTSAGISLNYEFGTSRTRATLSTGTGVTYYPELDNNRYDPNLYFNLGITHQVNLRLSLNASFAVHYRAEPDFSSTLTVDRRSGNYFGTDDSISASYQWLPRFSTVTNYGIATVLYDDTSTAAFGATEDRISHSFGQSFRFLYLPVTTITADYRLSFATYDGAERESTTQSFLVGFDHSINARLQGTLRGGVEFRNTDAEAYQTNDGFGPHAEASLSYVFGAKTSLSWSASYGTQEAYIAGSAASTTFRTGLQASYSITPRLSASLGGNYQHNENQTAEFFPGFSLTFTEDLIDLNLALSYSINRHFSANIGMSHSEVESDLLLFQRSYSRNRYFGGLSLTF